MYDKKKSFWELITSIYILVWKIHPDLNSHMLVTHANMKGFGLASLFWSRSWLYASSIKNKHKKALTQQKYGSYWLFLFLFLTEEAYSQGRLQMRETWPNPFMVAWVTNAWLFKSVLAKKCFQSWLFFSSILKNDLPKLYRNDAHGTKMLAFQSKVCTCPNCGRSV